ncbi:MAG: hypothetical protein N2560_01230 [Ignavibacteria bacterium]|nr:hypothetical protein [Ignavibacteria bacterium]
MKTKLVLILLVLITALACSNKSKEFEQKNKIPDTNFKKNEKFSFNIDTTLNFRNKKPVSKEILAKIFPQHIFDFKLEKVNKGTINHFGIQYNSASAEYISHEGLLLISIFDYVNFNQLPSHLKSIFELSHKDEVININNGLARISIDDLSHSNVIDIIYLQRFHIKIEAMNYPNFRESALDIINSLNFSILLYSSKVGNNGTI